MIGAGSECVSWTITPYGATHEARRYSKTSVDLLLLKIFRKIVIIIIVVVVIDLSVIEY